MQELPAKTEGIVRNLARTYYFKGKPDIVRLLVESRAKLELVSSDGWNGGTYYYELHLDVPAYLHAAFEDRIEELEAEFLEKITRLLRQFSNETIEKVVLTLELDSDESWRANARNWLESTSIIPNGPSSAGPQYDFFISHASEDKASFARPLAKSLRFRGAKVWFDEFTLRIGDGLRTSIDSGLADSRYGIVVLSKAFFAKNWPKYELDGLTARQMLGSKTILPIWHGVSRDDVAKYSLPLADMLAISSEQSNVNDIVDELLELLPQFKSFDDR